MALSSSNNDILNDDNYFLWELSARMALARKGLAGHVEITPEKAVALSDNEMWKTADSKAMGVIAKMLSSPYQAMIRNAKFAAEAWIILQQLDAVGDNVKDDEQLVVLLGSLSAEYDAIVKIIEARGNVDLYEAKEMLRREYETLQKRERQEAAFQSAVVRYDGRSRNDMKNKRQDRGQMKTSAPLEMVHTDLMGPINVKSKSGARFILVFVDDWSRYLHVYLLKSKTEVTSKFIEYTTVMERQTGGRVKCVRSDNGSEFCNKKFDGFCLQQGILHQTSAPYSPQQNGIAERANRSIAEMARAMLYYQQLSREWWGEAVMTAEVLWLRHLLTELGVLNMPPTVIYVDNQAAIAMVEHSGYQSRAKHIDLRYHFVRDAIESGELETKYVRSEDQLADFMTKAMPTPQFTKLVQLAGIRDDSVMAI
ncbi:hypothetical protein P43SY_003047 [Pythium insidiosum]|uniref:Integrase catalytic domain-containing protein n=1 Tax=Pythium insidiosum TaxID=114742 RepID=A0AAD5LKJ4_PYTIN|nr:hypothetical protein P43SY_003047 [Pythium insidiosum]